MAVQNNLMMKTLEPLLLRILFSRFTFAKPYPHAFLPPFFFPTSFSLPPSLLRRKTLLSAGNRLLPLVPIHLLSSFRSPKRCRFLPTTATFTERRRIHRRSFFVQSPAGQPLLCRQCDYRLLPVVRILHRLYLLRLFAALYFWIQVNTLNLEWWLYILVILIENFEPMADRSSSSMGFYCWNSLFYWLCLTSILFLLSSFFVLRSTGRPQFVFRPSSDANIVSDNINSGGGAAVFCEKVIAERGGRKEVLKVYMYDLRPEFHFGLLDWKPEGSNVWPDIRTTVPNYPGGLNLQHSIEYWLTLDLLFSEYSGSSNSRVAVRVRNSSEADVIFVPFFSSLSYNRFSRLRKQERSSLDKLTQDKLVQYLEAQEEWKRSGGVDHIIMAHHPNSLLYARNQLWPAMYILSDLGRYPPNIANVQKDIIAPYRHVIKSYVNDTSTYDSRPILLFFQGAIYRKDGGVIRQELFYLLKDERDVHFTFGSIQRGGVNNATQGMHSSKFCLNIAGDTPSSNRLFDAIASHCVPVIISDEIELPYEDIIDYSEFCIFVRTSDATKEKFLMNLIRGISKEEWTRMWRKLQEVEKYFEFRYPSRDDDAVQMIWKSIAHKVPAVKLKLNRNRRYVRTSNVSVDREPPAFMVPHNFL